jgi:uncharacterized protein
MQMLEVVQHNNEKKGEFEALFDGAHAGLMTYTWAGTDKFIIDHTEVEEAFNGKGVGKQLVLGAVDFARKNKVKIIPLCPFAKATFEKNEDLHDVLF